MRTVATTVVAALLTFFVSDGVAGNPDTNTYGQGTHTCSHQVATIRGTPDADRLVGSSEVDVIAGGAGDDHIVGGGGEDLICGGLGDDLVTSGRGADQILGESGNDRLLSRLGDDVILAGHGRDLLNAGDGVDRCRGGDGHDRLVDCESRSAGINWRPITRIDPNPNVSDVALEAEASGSASGTGTVTTEPKGKFSTIPEMSPPFDPVISDYVVRCDGAPLGVSAVPELGSEISVDNQPAHSGALETAVSLEPNQAFSVSIEKGSIARDYHVRCLPPNFPSWSFDRISQPHHSFYVITPRGTANPSGIVVIFNDYGVPVWWYHSGLGAIDAKVLRSGRVAYSTLFGGGSFGTDPRAAYYVRNIDGSLLTSIESTDGPGTIKTIGGPTDHHDMQELPSGNFLLISYQPRDHVDLTAFCSQIDNTQCGGPDDTVLDGVIQEISPTGQLIWEWNSKDHIALDETPPRLRGNILKDAFRDIVHLNALEFDGSGLLLSARNTDSIYRIDRATGEVDWKLGGTATPESLTVLNDSQGYPLGNQHDVRRASDGSITIHDNRSSLGTPPRAVRYEIDDAANTATMVEEIVDSEVKSSGCCGSARRSDDDSWLMSWGSRPLVTEFDVHRERTFRLTFENGMNSYRAVPVPLGSLGIEALRTGMGIMHPR